MGRRAVAVPADLLKREDLDRIHDAAMDAFGRVDVFVSTQAPPIAMAVAADQLGVDAGEVDAGDARQIAIEQAGVARKAGIVDEAVVIDATPEKVIQAAVIEPARAWIIGVGFPQDDPGRAGHAQQPAPGVRRRDQGFRLLRHLFVLWRRACRPCLHKAGRAGPRR